MEATVDFAVPDFRSSQERCGSGLAVGAAAAEAGDDAGAQRAAVLGCEAGNPVDNRCRRLHRRLGVMGVLSNELRNLEPLCMIPLQHGRGT